eukprot:7976275-Alexandrium_andersonii.AAC.1
MAATTVATSEPRIHTYCFEAASRQLRGDIEPGEGGSKLDWGGGNLLGQEEEGEGEEEQDDDDCAAPHQTVALPGLATD